MNRLGLIAALAVLCAASANAQNQRFDPAVPGALPDAGADPAREQVEPRAPQLVMNPKSGHNDADARECLQLATNEQVHRCAERYRARADRAKVVRTSVRSDPPKVKDVATPAGTGKQPDMGKTSDPAKQVDNTKPAATAQPASTAKSIASAKPAAGATSADTAKPMTATKPIEPVKSADTAKAAAAVKPVDAGKSAK